MGANDEEVIRAMPGDGIEPNPTFNATRAVTIQARPEEIWPWIMQIGFTRAGWYSYDWIDNLGRPSADRIIPELQTLKVGDKIPMSDWTYQVVHEIVPALFILITSNKLHLLAVMALMAKLAKMGGQSGWPPTD